MGEDDFLLDAYWKEAAGWKTKDDEKKAEDGVPDSVKKESEEEKEKIWKAIVGKESPFFADVFVQDPDLSRDDRNRILLGGQNEKRPPFYIDMYSFDPEVDKLVCRLFDKEKMCYSIGKHHLRFKYFDETNCIVASFLEPNFFLYQLKGYEKLLRLSPPLFINNYETIQSRVLKYDKKKRFSELKLSKLESLVESAMMYDAMLLDVVRQGHFSRKANFFEKMTEEDIKRLNKFRIIDYSSLFKKLESIKIANQVQFYKYSRSEKEKLGLENCYEIHKSLYFEGQLSYFVLRKPTEKELKKHNSFVLDLQISEDFKQQSIVDYPVLSVYLSLKIFDYLYLKNHSSVIFSDGSDIPVNFLKKEDGIKYIGKIKGKKYYKADFFNKFKADMKNNLDVREYESEDSKKVRSFFHKTYLKSGENGFDELERIFSAYYKDTFVFGFGEYKKDICLDDYVVKDATVFDFWSNYIEDESFVIGFASFLDLALDEFQKKNGGFKKTQEVYVILNKDANFSHYEILGFQKVKDDDGEIILQKELKPYVDFRVR